MNEGKDIPVILKEHEEFLLSTYKPCNEIIFKAQSTKPWESKLGGCPYLEDLKDYPLDEKGRPMMFLAQINFEEMPPLPDFPSKGLLQFYIVDDDCYGCDGGCYVRYLQQYRRDEYGFITENPYQKNYQGYEPFERSGKMQFSNREMPVGTECGKFIEHFPYNIVPEGQWNALYDLCYASGSRIGGYPHFTQIAPAYYDDGVCDVMLLQLDIEDECGIMFGDTGNCTFLIAKEELQNLDFSKVEYNWQCC